MKRILVTLVFLAAASVPVRAQEDGRAPLGLHRGTPIHAAERVADDAAGRHAAVEGEPRPVHVTDRINRLPAAREALREYRLHRTLGPVAAKQERVLRLGETRTFKVYNHAESGSFAPVFDDITFTLERQHERFNIWVEADSQHVQDAHLDSLYAAFGERTPSTSVDPDRGIVVNNEEIFGAPPNRDGDGRTDVLLVDVRDGRKAGEGYVAGFVWSGDLGTNGARGNGRDVVYIDTQPGLLGDDGQHKEDTRGVEATLAHEYQHLIHFAYDRSEETFVNEGLSEWAEVLNGYVVRHPSYLGGSDRYNVPLFRWSELDTGEGFQQLDDDYQRAGHFTNYVADRIGVAGAGRITQDGRHGADGYRGALAATGAGTTLETLIADFHVANLVNDAAADPRFGFTTPGRRGLRAATPAAIDGAAAETTAATEVRIEAGGVRYVVWKQVSDFTLAVDVADDPADAAAVADRRARLRPRLVLERGGAAEVRDLAPGPEVHTVDGTFDRVTLVLAHVLPLEASTLARYEAEWTETGVRALSVAYDAGESVDSLLYNMGGGYMFATRFDVPADGARLAKVSIAPYFLNQFAGTGRPAAAPRDVTLQIWAADPVGYPGEELAELTVEDPRGFSAYASALSFFDVDLSAHADVLSGLSGPVFVGYTEAGEDDNFLVLAVAPYEAEDVSFLGHRYAQSWTPLWKVQFTSTGAGVYPLDRTAVPIRAEFLVEQAVAVEDDGDVPAGLAIEQNYPNPFNPATAIRYHLPEAVEVHLAVYDLLGRRQAVLVDGLRPAGTHEARLDASTWASGVYVYVLHAGGRTFTRKMLLVR